MRKRVVAVLSALSVALLGICVRLLVIGNSVAFTAVNQVSSRVQTIAVSRGTIYDRYFTPLVNGTLGWRAAIAPYEPCFKAVQEVVELSADVENVALIVADISHAVTPADGVWQFEIPVRYGESLACHTIGYIDGEGNGVTGVERVCDDTLSRYTGYAQITYDVNALGQMSMTTDQRVTNTLDRCKGGVVLTLDAQVQRIAQQANRYIDRGVVVILSAGNADILASVSLPMYDPNDITAVLEQASSPLLDRTMINYNLGSVFKIIVAAAALESGIDSSKTYDCSGAIEVNGTVFHCHNRLGDGTQTMQQAMANSCNCYFIQLAAEVGAERVVTLARRAGMERALSLMDGMNTTRGLMPDEFDLTSAAALANFAMGQGELMATPYHVAMLYKAVADDGILQTPSLYMGTTEDGSTVELNASSHEETRLFSKETAQVLRQMLETVVTDGTGQEAMPCYGAAAGKTGTAQTGWEQNGETVTQSWFVGYYPADKPQYVIAVLSENGGNNGQSAAPVFAFLCDELFAAGLVEKAK